MTDDNMIRCPYCNCNFERGYDCIDGPDFDGDIVWFSYQEDCPECGRSFQTDERFVHDHTFIVKDEEDE